jgi:hypothetical protein
MGALAVVREMVSVAATTYEADNLTAESPVTNVMSASFSRQSTRKVWLPPPITSVTNVSLTVPL